MTEAQDIIALLENSKITLLRYDPATLTITFAIVKDGNKKEYTYRNPDRAKLERWVDLF